MAVVAARGRYNSRAGGYVSLVGTGVEPMGVESVGGME